MPCHEWMTGRPPVKWREVLSLHLLQSVISPGQTQLPAQIFLMFCGYSLSCPSESIVKLTLLILKPLPLSHKLSCIELCAKVLLNDDNTSQSASHSFLLLIPSLCHCAVNSSAPLRLRDLAAKSRLHPHGGLLHSAVQLDEASPQLHDGKYPSHQDAAPPSLDPHRSLKVMAVSVLELVQQVLKLSQMKLEMRWKQCSPIDVLGGLLVNGQKEAAAHQPSAYVSLHLYGVLNALLLVCQPPRRE
mmetsp:Transcript_137662/g.256853  ORF Transcript_137662/g.256853 Transcript_137662/m.256853 type:complete len:244 (-) Transcript_137662:600-1331(-)